MGNEALAKYAEYCHFFTGKLVVFRNGNTEVLLARRKGEQEFDSFWNFPGGRKERKDASILESLRREKEEELGKRCRIKLYPHLAFLTHFVRKDGIPVVIGCFPALYEGGEIDLCEDYSSYEWCDVHDLGVTPIIPGTERDLLQTLRLLEFQKDEEGISV